MEFSEVNHNRHIKTNILLGFDKEKMSEVLGLDDRYHPELVITLGFSDDAGATSYRLPMELVSDVI